MKFSAYSLLTKYASHFAGKAGTFFLAILVIVVWLITGPLFHFSDTWQLVINTGTTIVTFIMVFLIQNTQNRDTEAIQIKLDELIRATQGAHNAILDLEELDQEKLAEFKAKYEALARKARKEMNDHDDTGTPEVWFFNERCKIKNDFSLMQMRCNKKFIKVMQYKKLERMA